MFNVVFIMTVQLSTLTRTLDQLLRPGDFRDYCPNGLQVEGRAEIKRLITGVTASQALIEAAIEAEADAILVHHGYFWQGESPVLRGIKRERIRLLLAHDISLLAYHLPLDAHRELGNNAQLGVILGLQTEGQLVPNLPSKVGVHGSLDEPLSGEQLVQRITQRLDREPFHIPGRADVIRTIAWSTGAAQGAIEQAWEWGVDAYLTGEVSEQTFHFARETGMHFFAAGHHATERYGVQALGEHVAETLALSHQFIDIDNPV